VTPTSPTPANYAVPRHAATVLLLREGDAGVEILLTRRHENLAFMGGLWVFPGGTLSPTDLSSESQNLVPERSRAHCARLHDIHGRALTLEQCVGLGIAACRETFEETGLLLATTDEELHWEDDRVVVVQEHRRAIVSHPERFAVLLKEHGLQLQVDRLLYWAHWITPSNAPRRFDTRFFAAAVPSGQVARIDTVEASDHAWMRPGDALEASERGRMPVSQPTLFNLMELDDCLRTHRSLDEFLRRECARTIVPVLPKMLREGKTTMLLPWDPEYAQAPGEGAPAGIEYPSRLRSLPPRLVFANI
jgi:8-oxo-dGTP pyrophosphatase MutT (NUDIX family)